ncbi:hypothetical protein [Geobacter grbiciae]|uniref:hypothetical protein n=1 Tax=Geobacter grbiciae TaxID=155042 RepID=UPI001C00F49E|nr:hypothetical protein [Geobacter grbiciae]MBT1073975.1 hypothetical protein [Geobacter grbiciae]
MIDGLGHANASVLANVNFVKHLLGAATREGEAANDGDDEAERNRNNMDGAGVFDAVRIFPRSFRGLQKCFGIEAKFLRQC